MDKSAGNCIALNPTGDWPDAADMTNVQGCSSLKNDPIGCDANSECKWELTTPDAYTETISLLGKEYEKYINERALDCSRYRSLGTDKDTCNNAKMEIAEIKKKFDLMANDLETDIKHIEKKYINCRYSY